MSLSVHYDMIFWLNTNTDTCTATTHLLANIVQDRAIFYQISTSHFLLYLVSPQRGALL